MSMPGTPATSLRHWLGHSPRRVRRIPKGESPLGELHSDLAHTDPDRASKGLNLLAGILAVQTGFASRDSFLTSILAWLPDKTKPLANDPLPGFRCVLRRRQGHTVQVLAEKHASQFHGDIAKCLSSILQNAPVRRDLEQVADAELLALLAPSSTATVRDETSDTPPNNRLQTVETFRILRPLARGGFSQVVVALDEQLNRK